MDNRIVLGVISVFVVLAVIGSALTPMIDAYTTTTTTIDNEGAVGLRMDKVTSGDFTLNYGLVGDDFTATNGTDTQIIDDMCIFYADDNVAVWMDDSSVRMIGKDANDEIIDTVLSDDATITITKSADGVNVTDGTVDQTFPVPAWSYVPKSTGAYGFFLNETEINTGGLDVHYVGSFAGVNCYDSINTYDLPIILDAAITGSTLTGAKWIKAGSAADPEIELTPLEPGSLTPLDPGVISIDPEPDASIMTVPTPTYTEGDWGYDLVDGKAVIVSYSGTGGGIITVPATIGGYVVDAFGKGTSNSNVFDTSIVATGLIISEGITKINSYACKSCVNLTGNLVLPSTLTSLGSWSTFENCKFSGVLTIPEGITEIPNNGFQSNKLEKVILPSTIETIGSSAFVKMGDTLDTMIFKSSLTNIGYNALAWDYVLNNLVIAIDSDATLGNNIFAYTVSAGNSINILNLGDYEITQGFSGMTGTQDIRTEITALGYLAPAQYNETVTDDSPMAALLKVIPLIAIIAVITMAVGVFIAHRME